MQIRRMLASDFHQAYQLWKESGLDVASYKREKTEVEMILKHNLSTCFVILNDGQIVGTILGAFNGRRAWIYHLAVDPKYQRRGLGKKLMNKVEVEFIKRKVTKILLGLGLWNLKLYPFYEESGYKIMNDSIFLAKDLYSQVSHK